MPDIYDRLASLAPQSKAPTSEAQPEERRQSVYDRLAALNSPRNAPPVPTGLEPSEANATNALTAGLRVGRTPEEHEQYLREAGYNPEAVKSLAQQYRLAFAQKQEQDRIPGKARGMVANNAITRNILPSSLVAAPGENSMAGQFFNPGSETWRESFRTGTALNNLPLRSVLPRSLDPSISLNEYREAVARIQKGEVSEKDAHAVAQYERQQGIAQEMNKTTGGAILYGISSVPGMAGEALIGGQLLRGVGIGGRMAGQRLGLLGEAGGAAPLTGQALSNAPASTIRAALAEPSRLAALGTHLGRAALITPLMPSMYVEQAQRNNQEAGRDPDGPDAWKGYPGAMLQAYANVAVLGRIFNRAGQGQSILKATGTGMAEQQGADAITGLLDDTLLPDLMKTKSKYGLLGHAIGLGGQKASASETLKAAIMQGAQFAAFAGLHAAQDGKEPGLSRLDKVKAEREMNDINRAMAKDLDTLKDSGLSEKVVSQRLLDLQARIQNEIAGEHMNRSLDLQNRMAVALGKASVLTRGEPTTAADVLAKMTLPGTNKPSSLAARMAEALKKAGELQGEQPRPLAERMQDALKRADELGQEPGAQKPAVDPLADTRGRGVQYHGARGPIKGLGESYYSSDNIYGGEGTFYTTDAHDIATGYGRKNPSALVYRVHEKGPIKSYDMEQRQKAGDWIKTFSDADSLFFDAVKETSKGGKHEPNLREIMDEMREQARHEGLSKDDVQEIFTTMVDRLRQEGYGAMTHKGGLQTKKQPHHVKIYFDPANQLHLESMESAKPKESPTPAEKPAEPVSEKPTDLTQTPPPKGEIAPESLQRPAEAPPAEVPPQPEIVEPAKPAEAKPEATPPEVAKEPETPPQTGIGERQAPALTPRQAKSQWAGMTKGERESLSPDVKSQLFSAMKKSGINPETVKPKADKADRATEDLARVFKEKGLNGQERSVMLARAQNKTMEEVGKSMGVSRQRVDQIEKAARAKLGVQTSLANQGFRKPTQEGAELAGAMAAAERGKVDVGEARRLVANLDTKAPRGKPASEQRSSLESLEKQISDLTDQYIAAAEKNPAKAAKLENEIKSLSEQAAAVRKFLTEEGGWATFEWVDKLVDWFKWLSGTGASKGKGPAVKLDNTNILPRPQETSEYKLIVSEPGTAGRIPGLGRFLDPARTDTSPESKALTARQALADQGKNIASSWASHRPGVEADRLFKADAEGTYLRGDGSRGRMADDIEAHMRGEETALSDEQKTWVDKVWTPLLRDMQKMMKEEGISEWMDDSDKVIGTKAKAYFPRTAIGKKGLDAKADPSRGKRLYESEEEGSETTIYDPSAKSRVAKLIAGSYSAIANHRLATDPALQGKTPAERYEQSLVENAEVLKGMGPKERKEFENDLRTSAGRPLFGKEAFVQGSSAFQGRIFPIEIAKKIENLYKQEDYKPIKTIEKISAAAKGITLGLDFGYTTIQLLPLMYTKPRAWAKATHAGLRAFFDPNYMAKRLEAIPEDAQAARDLTQLGSSIGRLHDSMAGLQQGEFATRLPVVGKVYEATGRAMGTALDVAKIELWKAWSKGTEPHQLRQLAESIDAMLLQGRMESIGLSPRRMMWERLLMNAPAYYRGGINFIAGAFQKGVPGTMMRTAMAATIGGITLSSFAAMIAAGLSQDEILERFNPARGKFLKVPIPLGDNKKIEVGYSNILTSYARLTGMAADYFASSKPINTGTDGNPMLRWLRGKAAFSPRLLTDLITGKDYQGNRVQVHEATMKAFEPLAIQTLLHGEGSVSDKGFGPTTGSVPKKANLADAIISVLGFSSYSGSKTDEKYAVFNDESQKRFGKKFDALDIGEQIQVVKAAKNRPDMPPAEASSSTEMERAIALQAERKQKITSMVSKESRSKLSKLEKELPSYLGVLSINNTDLPLSHERLARYEKFLADEYNKTIGSWDVPQIRSMDAGARERFMEKMLTKAKDRAKHRLMGEWN